MPGMELPPNPEKVMPSFIVLDGFGLFAVIKAGTTASDPCESEHPCPAVMAPPPPSICAAFGGLLVLYGSGCPTARVTVNVFPFGSASVIVQVCVNSSLTVGSVVVVPYDGIVVVA